MDNNEDYVFPEMEATGPKKKHKPILPDNIPMDKLLADTRRVDDALLHALSLVLSSNSEYARSVSALLENDLDKEQTISQIHSETHELLEQTKKLLVSQDNLTELLNAFTDDYKSFFETTLDHTVEQQQEYLDEKFTALFLEAGLKSDGTEHAPADKLILTMKNFITQKIGMFLASVLIYHFALLLVKKMGGM